MRFISQLLTELSTGLALLSGSLKPSKYAASRQYLWARWQHPRANIRQLISWLSRFLIMCLRISAAG